MVVSLQRGTQCENLNTVILVMGPPKEGTLNFVKPPSQEVTGLRLEILVGVAFTFLEACFIAPEVSLAPSL